jgi:hypothetical protein
MPCRGNPLRHAWLQNASQFQVVALQLHSQTICDPRKLFRALPLNGGWNPVIFKWDGGGPFGRSGGNSPFG